MASPTTSSARRTRDRVLDAALELFDERGSAAVTTNHVAARAGISPGNLYCWFGDKDEIVRELYARLVAAHEALWATRDRPTDPTPDELLDRIADGAALSRRYAFLAREVLSLLHADPVLAAAYTTVRAQRVALFTALARGWRDQVVIRPLGDREVADLMQALWIISETWLAFSGLDGTCVDADDGARLLRTVLRPHLTRDHSEAGRIATTSAAVPP